MLAALLAALLVMQTGPAQSQVCEGDVLLNCQAQMNAFACTDVTGTLMIRDADADVLVDLSPLSNLTTVSILLIEDNDSLTTLAGSRTSRTSKCSFSLTITSWSR